MICREIKARIPTIEIFQGNFKNLKIYNAQH